MSDDFEESDLDLDDASFDDFEEKNSSVGSFFQDNPIAKIGLVVGAIVIVFGGIVLFGGQDAPIDQSFLGAAPDIATPPGTEAASPEYIEAIQEVNERDVEIAEQTGGSAFPTPIQPPVGILTVPEQEADAEDPLQRWRRLQEERLQRELQQAQTIEPTSLPDDTARNEAIQQLADAMAAQMQAVLDNKENTVSYRSLTDPEAFNQSLADAAEAQNELDDTFDAGELEEEVIQEVLLPAGEIAYATLLIEANTDAPGPILAQILSGPLKGGKLIGAFEEQRNFLTLNFSTLVLNEVSLGVSAVAIDPNTTLPGFATEINRRYLSRVLLPAAAAFITGFTEAVAETGRTTITIEGDTVAEDTEDADSEQEIATGFSELGEELSEIIDEEADLIEPLIRVAPGTPLGILFTQSVVTEDEAI